MVLRLAGSLAAHTGHSGTPSLGIRSDQKSSEPPAEGPWSGTRCLYFVQAEPCLSLASLACTRWGGYCQLWAVRRQGSVSCGPNP